MAAINSNNKAGLVMLLLSFCKYVLLSVTVPDELLLLVNGGGGGAVYGSDMVQIRSEAITKPGIAAST